MSVRRGFGSLLAIAVGACSSGVTPSPPVTDAASPGALTMDASPAPDRSLEIRKVIDDAVSSPMKGPNAVGLVVIVIDGDDRVQAFYGEKKKGSGAAPDPSTLFEIGSLSKTFTATLLAWYAQKGVVALGDTLGQYLPAPYQFPAGDAKLHITLEQAATHTSGFPRNPDDVAGATTYSSDALFHDADTVALSSAPGAAFLYSNLAYALLGDALANKAGGTWESSLEAVITNPLGMGDTRGSDSLSADQLVRIATGYASTASGPCTTPPCPVSPTLILGAFPAPGVIPAGGAYSSTVDMTTWLAYNIGLSPNAGLNALLDALRRKRVPVAGRSVGLAWNISSFTMGGAPVDEIWKDGDTNGFHAFIAYVAARHAGIVVMANSTLDATPQELGETILAALP